MKPEVLDDEPAMAIGTQSYFDAAGMVADGALHARVDDHELRSQIQVLGGYEGDADLNYTFDRPDGAHVHSLVLSGLTALGEPTLPTSLEDDCLLSVWHEDGSEPFASMKGKCMNLLVVVRLMLDGGRPR